MKPVIILALLAFAACSGETSGEATSATDTWQVDRAASPPMRNEGVATSAPRDRQESGGDNVGQPAALAISPPRPPALADSASVAPSMLIRTGNASVEVDSVELAVARVQELAQRLGGYVGNTSVSGGEQATRSATLEVKIPAARFDQAVNGLRPLGKVESVQVHAEDVGEEYVDLSARTANARRLEERLLGLLATRTGKLEDVLAVERELARVRQEIDTQEGRLRFLRSRAAVSTLNVTVHEPRALIGDHPRARPIREAFRDAWRNFIGFTAGLIASLGFLVPLGLIVAVLVWAVRRLRRRRSGPGGGTPPARQPTDPPAPSGR
ncbi:MAG TPA: DUF4349 domain-containing protein [Longimicrobium sp.]|jgi:hypothetical protein